MVEKIGHYSLENPASIYDEEAMTALELAGRTAGKVNECVQAFNDLEKRNEETIKDIKDNIIPDEVDKEVLEHIQMGDFNAQIDHHTQELVRQLEENDRTVQNLEETTADYKEEVEGLGARLDNLLGSVSAGSTSMDAEVIDARTGFDNTTYANLGTAIRKQFEKACVYRGGIAAGESLDAERLPGYYYVNKGVTGTLPENVDVINAAAWLLVYGTGKLVVQVVVSTYNGNSAMRVNNGIAWTKWIDLSTPYTSYKGSLLSDDNLDNVLAEGEYWVSRVQTTQGTSPPVITNYNLLEVTGVQGKNWIVQKWFTFPNGNTSPAKMYIRTYMSNLWSPWVEITRDAHGPVEIVSPWSGKNLCVMGDSIMENGELAGYIKSTLNLNKVTNLAVGGSTLTSRGSELDTQYTPVHTLVGSVPSDTDIILIHAGTNDVSSQVPLGSETSTDPATFNGALNTLMGALRDRFPDKLIIFDNILHRYNDTNPAWAITTKQYREALEARCYDNQMVFYDSYKYSGFNFAKGYYDKACTDDGLHPNGNGYAILGRKLSAFINMM